MIFDDFTPTWSQMIQMLFGVLRLSHSSRDEDLKLLDDGMVEEVVKAVDMKLVSAQKFRLALAELRGKSTSQQTQHTPSGNQQTSNGKQQKQQRLYEENVIASLIRESYKRFQ